MISAYVGMVVPKIGGRGNASALIAARMIARASAEELLGNAMGEMSNQR